MAHGNDKALRQGAAFDNLPIEVVELVVAFGGTSKFVAALLCTERKCGKAAEQAARVLATSALGQDLVLMPGEKWVDALYFSEVQAGVRRRTWAMAHRRFSVESNRHVSEDGEQQKGLIMMGCLRDDYYDDGDDWEDVLEDVGPLATEHQIVQVDVYFHVAAVTQSGKLLVAGFGRYGRLGLGTEDDHHGYMTEVGGELAELHVVYVATGSNRTAVVTSHGWLFTFGWGPLCGLGRYAKLNVTTPCRVLGALANRRVLQVAVGDHVTAVVTTGGELYTFGCGGFGGLGHGKIGVDEVRPRRVIGLLVDEWVTSAAVGRYHTVALTAKGTVFTFGTDIALGHGGRSISPRGRRCPFTMISCMLPKRVVALALHWVVCIVAGCRHTGVLTDKGVVLTFGNNTWGQLGRDYVTDAGPTEVHWMPGEVHLNEPGLVIDLMANKNRTTVEVTGGSVEEFGYGEFETDDDDDDSDDDDSDDSDSDDTQDDDEAQDYEEVIDDDPEEQKEKQRKRSVLKQKHYNTSVAA
jgi:hypothetical protein